MSNIDGTVENIILMTCCGNRYATVAETIDHECPVTDNAPEWASLDSKGLTYGDTFIWYGNTWATRQLKGVEVRIVQTTGKRYDLIATADGQFIERATSLKSAKWWIG